MKRRWKILIGVLAALAVLLAVNTIVVDNETKGAEITVDGGQILELPGGDVQVTDTGEPQLEKGRPGAPIVLIHCYACSLHWWDRLLPLLAERHRVVRIDLLGHGGSEKPSSGYSMKDQAALTGAALNQLGIEGAVVVGHSLGATVATAVAEQSSQLVDRIVDIDQAPDASFGDVPFLAKLGYVPVIGEAAWRVVPDFAVKDSYQDLFAPGFDIDSGFEDPDQVVDDYNAMTYTSFDSTESAADAYTEEIPLDERIRSAAISLMVIFGTDDQVYDAEPAANAYSDVPGTRIEMIPDAGHSPNIEQPEKVAALIEDFAAEAEVRSTG